MKKLMLVCLVSTTFLLQGCVYIDRFFGGITGNASKACIDGVTYLQFTSGATVQVDVNGKHIVCK